MYCEYCLNIVEMKYVVKMLITWLILFFKSKHSGWKKHILIFFLVTKEMLDNYFKNYKLIIHLVEYTWNIDSILIQLNRIKAKKQFKISRKRVYFPNQVYDVHFAVKVAFVFFLFLYAVSILFCLVLSEN